LDGCEARLACKLGFGRSHPHPSEGGGSDPNADEMAVIALPVEVGGESSMLIEMEMVIRMAGKWSRRSSRPAPTVNQGLTRKAPLVRVDLATADASAQRLAVDKMRREAGR
jgi:hypothetical protein